MRARRRTDGPLSWLVYAVLAASPLVLSVVPPIAVAARETAPAPAPAPDVPCDVFTPGACECAPEE